MTSASPSSSSSCSCSPSSTSLTSSTSCTSSISSTSTTSTSVLLQAALRRGESVLLHCSAGLHRTGTVAYAVLRASGWGESDAARGLQLMRPETAAGVGQLAESAFRPV